MRKKVINSKKNYQKREKKLVAYLTALILGISSLSVPAYAESTNNNISYSQQEINSKLVILQTLYTEQQNYLNHTIADLKQFFAEKDSKNIIKEAYPNVYETISNQLDQSYPLNSEEEYIESIKENNRLIQSLKIKPLGTGRDPEYGIISDQNSEFGFRVKTEEDKALIDGYTNILGNPLVVNEKLLKLIETPNDEIDKEEYLSTIESLINNQINYLINVDKNLQKFYEERDTQNIIKEAYPNAYEAINYKPNCYISFNGNSYQVAKDQEMSLDEILKNYIEVLNNNNYVIASLKIKPLGTGRDPEYGIISDQNSELGFRIKTEEDKALIDEYTSILGNLETIPTQVLDYLNNIYASLSNNIDLSSISK